jgi:hypothetical protein
LLKHRDRAVQPVIQDFDFIRKPLVHLSYLSPGIATKGGPFPALPQRMAFPSIVVMCMTLIARALAASQPTASDIWTF